MLESARALYLLKSSPRVLGAQLHVLDLVEAFAPRFEHTVVAGNPVPFAERFAEAGAEWAPLPPFDGPLGLMLVGLRLRILARRHRPHFIHSHHRFLTTAARLFVRHIPLVHTAHNVFTTGRRFTLLGDNVIAVSDGVRRNLIEYFGCRPEHVVTIYNGIRPLPDSPPPADISSDSTAAMTLLCPARLEIAKGHTFLLQALAQLRQQGLSVRALVAGEGSLESDLRRQAHELALNDSVIFLGHRGDMPSLYRLADAVVLPSVQEGLPYSLLEAASVGKACVATTVGGVPEIIRDQVTGILVAPADASGLCSAIRRLASDPELRARLGAQAQRDVAERFSIDTMLARTSDRYLASLSAGRLLRPQ
jgi:glycosyltransferase involved in cell wall biosynthesis